MMSEVIRQETFIFLTAILHGMMLSLIYDIIRAVRRVFAHSIAAVSAEDFLFWLMAGFLTFCLLFRETDGVIRGYVAVGAMLGVAIYLVIFSRLVIKVIAGTLGGFRKLVSIIRNVIKRTRRKIIKVLKFVFRPLYKPLRNIAKKFKKRIEIIIKRVYNRKSEKRAAKGSAVTKKYRNNWRGSVNGSKQKRGNQQEQPQGNARYCGGGAVVIGSITDSESETDREE